MVGKFLAFYGIVKILFEFGEVSVKVVVDNNVCEDATVIQVISKDSEPLLQQNPASTVAPTVNGVGQSQISYKTIISSMKTSSYVRL
ncbi:hypothetical protein CRYUN_Cryun15aG0000600 [Craigia yunnanensis]